MTEDKSSIEEIYLGTQAVAENLKFDQGKLQEWIDSNAQPVGKIINIEQFKGGQSNPTYKLSTENKNFVLRRKPPGKLLPSAHAVDREYKVITSLFDTDVPVPMTYGLCEDADVIGTPFFIMDFLMEESIGIICYPTVQKKKERKYINKRIKF